MKKGFTLIELLAVIIVLSILTLMTVPAVNKIIMDAKDNAYQRNIDAIEKAAYDWALQNIRALPKTDNESIVVYLSELKLLSNVDMNIKNPKTGKLLSNNTSVTITKTGNEYTYTLNLIEIDKNDDSNAPILVISGDVIDYVEVNQEGNAYVIPTTISKTSTGEPINSGDAIINYQIIKDNVEVSTIDTSKLGKYRLIFSITYNGATGTYEKEVIIRDTTKPVITIDDDITCTVATIPLNLLEGVTVTDNSGENIVPTIDSEIKNMTGTYKVTYTATDSSGNKTSKVRSVVVE